MSFDSLKEAIDADVLARVQAIEAQSKQRLHEEESRIKQAARALEERIIDEAEEQGAREARRLHQEHHLDAKAHVLQAKQQELQKAEDAVVTRILNLTTDETRQLLERFFALITEKKGMIVPGEHHVSAVRKLAKQRGFTVLDEVIPDDGGFVFRGTDSELNVTVRQVVRQLFVQQRARIAARLFS